MSLAYVLYFVLVAVTHQMTWNRATTKVVREGDWRTEEGLVIKNPPGTMKKSHKAVSNQILASGYTKGTC